MRKHLRFLRPHSFLARRVFFYVLCAWRASLRYTVILLRHLSACVYTPFTHEFRCDNLQFRVEYRYPSSLFFRRSPPNLLTGPYVRWHLTRITKPLLSRRLLTRASSLKPRRLRYHPWATHYQPIAGSAPASNSSLQENGKLLALLHGPPVQHPRPVHNPRYVRAWSFVS